MITEVSLENFKCFCNLKTIELSKVNLFAGCNGRGKSTFMQSLLLLAQSLDSEKRLNHLALNGRFISLGTFDDVRSVNMKTNPIIRYKTDDDAENDLTIAFSAYERKKQWGKLLKFSVSEKN